MTLFRNFLYFLWYVYFTKPNNYYNYSDKFGKLKYIFNSIQGLACKFKINYSKFMLK